MKFGLFQTFLCQSFTYFTWIFKSEPNTVLDRSLCGQFIIVYIVRLSVAYDSWSIRKFKKQKMYWNIKNGGVLKMATLLFHQNSSKPFILSHMYKHDKSVVKITTSRAIFRLSVKIIGLYEINSAKAKDFSVPTRSVLPARCIARSWALGSFAKITLIK